MESTRINDDKSLRVLLEKYFMKGGNRYQNSKRVAGLSKAVADEDLPKLMELVKSGSSFGVSDIFGNGPYHIAVAKNNALILDYLLSQDKEHINKRNFLGKTPLLKAMLEEKYDFAEKLIRAGANVNMPDDNTYTTPLHRSTTFPRFARLLIEYGANVNCRNYFNETPLHAAVQYGSLEAVCMLLYYNADVTVVNKNQYTPLMIAIEGKNEKIQEALLDYVDDYDFPSRDSAYSVFGWALIHESPFAEEMIRRGADVNNVSSDTGAALFLVIEQARRSKNINLNLLRLICDRIGDDLAEINILESLYSLETSIFHCIIDVLVNCDRFSVIANSVTKADDLYKFILRSIEKRLPIDVFSKFFCLLLTHGYIPSETDMILLFHQWGYSELFRISVYFNIRSTKVISLGHDRMAKFICNITFDTNVFLDSLTNTIKTKRCPLDSFFAVAIFRVPYYFVYPPLINAYLDLNKTLKMRALPKIPSLVELARNKTREHIKKLYNVTDSCHFYTLINSLNIPTAHKKILTLETVLYKPTFKEEDFQLYLKLIKMVTDNEYIVEPLIQSAFENSIIV